MAGLGVEVEGEGDAAPKPPNVVAVCPKENPAVTEEGVGEAKVEDVAPKVGMDDVELFPKTKDDDDAGVLVVPNIGFAVEEVSLPVDAPPKGFGAANDIGGYAPPLELDEGFFPVDAPPKGFGAVDDIGGYPPAGLFDVTFFSVETAPKGFGADNDIGGYPPPLELDVVLLLVVSSAVDV